MWQVKEQGDKRPPGLVCGVIRNPLAEVLGLQLSLTWLVHRLFGVGGFALPDSPVCFLGKISLYNPTFVPCEGTHSHLGFSSSDTSLLPNCVLFPSAAGQGQLQTQSLAFRPPRCKSSAGAFSIKFSHSFSLISSHLA